MTQTKSSKGGQTLRIQAHPQKLDSVTLVILGIWKEKESVGWIYVQYNPEKLAKLGYKVTMIVSQHRFLDDKFRLENQPPLY